MEIVDKAIHSVLKMKNLYFEKILFEREGEVPKNIKTTFSTEFLNEKSNEFAVKLKCNVICGEKQLIEIILVGEFENKEEDLQLREEINKINTVSIMFPYLRAELSLLTAQPNFPTLDLPPININALLAANGVLTATRN